MIELGLDIQFLKKYPPQGFDKMWNYYILFVKCSFFLLAMSGLYQLNGQKQEQKNPQNGYYRKLVSDTEASFPVHTTNDSCSTGSH